MKLYKITIEETLSKTVIVEAENIDKAYDKVCEALDDEIIILTDDDYQEDSRKIIKEGEAGETDALFYQNIEEIEGFDDIINDFYKWHKI